MRKFIQFSAVFILLCTSSYFMACQKINVEKSQKTAKNDHKTSLISRFNIAGAKHWVDSQMQCMAGEPDNCTVSNLIDFNDNNVQNVINSFNDLIAIPNNAAGVQDFFNGSEWHIIFPILAESYMTPELELVRSGNCIVELVINTSDNTHYYLFKRLEGNNAILDFVIPTQQES